MTLEEIRRYTDSMSDKHRSGKTLTEQEFNDVIKVVNIELFNSEFSLLEKVSGEKDIPLNKILIDSTSLKEFKVYGEEITLSSGIGDLPTNYRYYLYLKTKPFDGLLKMRNIEVVDDLSFNMIQNTMYIFDLRQYPQAVMYQDNFRVIPTDTTRVELGYLKKPANPYYDYVIKSTTGAIIYMPVNSVLDGGILYTDSSESTVIATGVIHSSGIDPVTSTTVELEWREDIHTHFANGVLMKIGIPLKDKELFEMAKIENQ